MGKKAFQSPFTVGSNYAINGSVIRILNLTKRESIIKNLVMPKSFMVNVTASFVAPYTRNLSRYSSASSFSALISNLEVPFNVFSM